MTKRTFLPTWIVFVILGLAVIIAIAGFVIARQSNKGMQLAHQGLATAQAVEQSMGNQVALAESTAQAALRQQANAERVAQEARNAQATAESDAQQRALVEAMTNQEVQAAQAETMLATSRWLAAQSLNTLEQGPQLSAHLALQAMEAGQTFEAENALHQVLPELRLLSSKLISDIVPNAGNGNSHTLVKDGELLILVTSDGIVVVDMVSGTHTLLTNTKNCYHVEATQDGLWLLTGCSGGYQVRSVETQELLFTLPDQGHIIYYTGLIPPSPSHSLMLFYIPDDKSIHVWDAISGKERFVFPSLTDDAWYGIVASSDGSRLARMDGKGQVVLWNMDSGQKMVEFEPVSDVHPVAFSPDGTRLVLAGTTIQIWDISSPTQEPVLLQEILLKNWFSGFAFNSDGSRLAIGFFDGQVQVWETETGQLLLTLYGGSELSGSMAFSRDGNRLYAVSPYGTAMEWDISGVMNGLIGSAPYSPDGSRLALASDGGYVAIVDSQTGEVQLSWQAQTGWSYLFSDIAWSPDGEHLATFYINDNTARIWEAATGRLLQELPVPPETEFCEGFIGIAWSPDSRRIATLLDYCVHGYELRVWNVDSGEQLLTLDTGGWFAYPDLDFSPDGTKIAAGAAYCHDGPTDCDYELVIWDSTTGAELFRLGSDSRQASSSGGGRKVLARLANPDALVWVSPNWRNSYSDWFRPSFVYLSRNVFAVDFSPDGNYLAAGTLEGIILWKFTQDGVEQDRVLGIQSDENGYYSISYSPDGTLLASASRGGKIRVWDLETGQVRWEIANGVYVAFSPDGTRLAITNNSTTNIHVVLLDELISEVRSHIIRPLTPEECLAYLHEETCPATP